MIGASDYPPGYQTSAIAAAEIIANSHRETKNSLIMSSSGPAFPLCGSLSLL